LFIKGDIEIILLIIAVAVSGCDGSKSLKDFREAKLDWHRKLLPYIKSDRR
jgi:hypothetical protein